MVPLQPNYLRIGRNLFRSEIPHLVSDTIDPAKWKIVYRVNCLQVLEAHFFLPKLGLSDSALLGDPLSLSSLICNRTKNICPITTLRMGRTAPIKWKLWKHGQNWMEFSWGMLHTTPDLTIVSEGYNTTYTHLNPYLKWIF